MSYHYEVLEEVLISVGKDFSDENIYTQLQRLTSDEMAKLKYLFDVAEDCFFECLSDCLSLLN